MTSNEIKFLSFFAMSYLFWYCHKGGYNILEVYHSNTEIRAGIKFLRSSVYESIKTMNVIQINGKPQSPCFWFSMTLLLEYFGRN